MNEVNHNGHTVMLQDNVQELPIGRYLEFQRHLMAAANIGSTVQDVDLRLRRHQGFLAAGEWNKARVEAENLHLAIRSAISKLNPSQLAFAVLVESIDGETVNDHSEAGLKRICTRLEHTGLTWSLMKQSLENAKKKFSSSWSPLRTVWRAQKQPTP